MRQETTVKISDRSRNVWLEWRAVRCQIGHGLSALIFHQGGISIYEWDTGTTFHIISKRQDASKTLWLSFSGISVSMIVFKALIMMITLFGRITEFHYCDNAGSSDWCCWVSTSLGSRSSFPVSRLTALMYGDWELKVISLLNTSLTFLIPFICTLP